MWNRMQQQQQRGAQLHARERGGAPGEAPSEAVKDRQAQQHDMADQDVSLESAPQPPVYPAGRLEDEQGDNTPTLPEGKVDWDDVVQPPRGTRTATDMPLPDGK